MQITTNINDVGHPVRLDSIQPGRWYRKYTEDDDVHDEVYFMRAYPELDFAVRVSPEDGGVNVIETEDVFVVPCPPGFQITIANDPPPDEDEEDDDPPVKKAAPYYARKGKIKKKPQ